VHNETSLFVKGFARDFLRLIWPSARARWPGRSVLAAEDVGYLSGEAVSGRAPKADGYDDRTSAPA
jgi:hypothetical protein